jgi:hypothetical protein
MPNLSDIKIAENKYDVADADQLPEQRGGYQPLLQPGDYEFQLPSGVAGLWEPTNDGKNLKLSFYEEPLIVSRASNPQDVGLGYRGQLNTVPLNRAKKGEPPVLVDDLTNLLRFGFKDAQKVTSKTGLATAVNSHAGQFFKAKVEWSAKCDASKTRFLQAEDNTSVEDPSGAKGCGTKLYESKIPRNPDGSYPERFACPQCGAYLRAFGNITRFRPPSE